MVQLLKPKYPPLAISFGPNSFTCVKLMKNGGESAVFKAHVEKYQTDFFKPVFTQKNISDKTAFQSAVTSTLQKLNATRSRRISLALPDSVAKVLTFDFEDVPAKEQDLIQLLKYKAKKILPYDIDSAVVTYQLMEAGGTKHRFIAGFMYKPLVSQYIDYFAELGINCGLIDTHSNCLVNLYRSATTGQKYPQIYVTLAKEYISLMMEANGNIVLHRTKVVPSEITARFVTREILQSVMFWFDYLEGNDLPRVLILQNEPRLKFETIETEKGNIVPEEISFEKLPLPIDEIQHKQKIEMEEVYPPLSLAIRSLT